MLYLPAYMASQLLRTGVLVLHKMFVQIRQHFQTAVNEIYQTHHVFNAILAANPVGIQRPEGLLLIVVGFDGPTQLVQLQMNSSRNSFEMMFLSRFIILQSVVTRYLFVQKVVNCCSRIYL